MCCDFNLRSPSSGNGLFFAVDDSIPTFFQDNKRLKLGKHTHSCHHRRQQRQLKSSSSSNNNNALAFDAEQNFCFKKLSLLENTCFYPGKPVDQANTTTHTHMHAAYSHVRAFILLFRRCHPCTHHHVVDVVADDVDDVDDDCC